MYVGSAVCNPKSIIRVCKKCPFSTYDCKGSVVVRLQAGSFDIQTIIFISTIFCIEDEIKLNKKEFFFTPK